MLERMCGKKVRARHNHVCMYCKDTIEAGKIYHYNKYFDVSTRESTVYKLHLNCVDIFYDKMAEIYRQADHWEWWYSEIFV